MSERLDEIPGPGREAAAALIAEIGLDMSRFPTPEALVSWAGLTPTARQSGPRSGRGKKGHGNTYAKRIAVLAAYAAANTDTFLGERFRRLSSRPGGGRKKAGCAVGRSILRGSRYRDSVARGRDERPNLARLSSHARQSASAAGGEVFHVLQPHADAARREMRQRREQLGRGLHAVLAVRQADRRVIALSPSVHSQLSVISTRWG